MDEGSQDLQRELDLDGHTRRRVDEAQEDGDDATEDYARSQVSLSKQNTRQRTGEDKDAPRGLQDNTAGTAVTAADADRDTDDPKRGVDPLRDLGCGHVTSVAPVHDDDRATHDTSASPYNADH